MGKSKEEEYKEIFYSEAIDSLEELNRLFTAFEKSPKDKNAVDAIFRITHTLKGNAAGMGFEDIAKMSHTLEDLFGEIREGNFTPSPENFTDFFKAVDVLGALIEALKTDKTVRYKGIKTKLEVLLRKAGIDKTKTSSPNGKSETEDSKPIKKESPSESKDADNPLEIEVTNNINATIEEVKKNSETEDTESNSNQSIKEKPEEPLIDQEAITAIVNQVEDALSDDDIKREELLPEKEDEEEDEEEIITSKISISDHVQVPVSKLDNLLNLVGELIIERDRIIANSNGSSNENSRLYRISSDLQYSVMDVRLVQVGFLFNKFHRVVRDAANVENKKVELALEGTDTEIDRNILQIISDSLIHLIRNAIGHGIEKPEERLKQNKSETGIVTLSAKNENDNVVIEIKDDGKGMDVDAIKRKSIEKGIITSELAAQLTEQDIIMNIFEPGFSSMDTVTAISGRGVGMDVVRKAIDSVGGNISVLTEKGKGSTIQLYLPSSMAVKGALLFEIGKDEYAIPLSYTDAVVSLYKTEIHQVGTGLVARHQDKNISILFLTDLFKQDKEGDLLTLQQSYNELHDESKLDVIVVNYNNKEIGFVVDKLLQQKEIVEKPLMKPVDQVKFISGVTILGNGHVCLVINPGAIINHVYQASSGNGRFVSAK